MKRIGRDVSAAEYWQKEGSDYHDAIENAYHRHRLGVVRSLIETQPMAVLDFGCGDGVMLAGFPGARLIGIEPDSGLVEQARQRAPRAPLMHGGVERMAEVPEASVDLVLCLNVLAYMTDAEDRAFYEHAQRVLHSGGTLIVTHSNELFDLFSLNAYTVDFFQRYFGCDPSAMLKHPDKPNTATYNIRENPLTYHSKLERYGFREDKQAFINLHEQPPLMGKSDEMRDTLRDDWTLMFRCSTFASRSHKG